MVIELMILGAVGACIHVAYARLVEWASGGGEPGRQEQ